MHEVFKIILKNPSQLTTLMSVIGWLFIVGGWVIALILQRNNVKQQHRVQIKHDIYKQFVQLHKAVQDPLGKLRAAAHPPFISMESSMIPFDLKLDKEYKGRWIPYNEHECLFDGEQKWSKFVNELLDLYFDFTDQSLKMLYVFEDWEAALKQLLNTKRDLFAEIESLKKQIHNHIDILRSFPTKYGHDWRKWDQQEADELTQGITEITDSISMYHHDFMVLIHNELLTKYFRHKRPTRKTLDSKYKVLTKKGFVQNVDWDKVKKSKVWKALLDDCVKKKLQKFNPPKGIISSEYNQYLESIITGECPDCKTDILVMKADMTEDCMNFQFACGHGYKIFNINELVSIKALYKVVTRREVFGLVRKIVKGWKPSIVKLNKLLNKF